MNTTTWVSAHGVKTEIVRGGAGRPILFLHGREGTAACKPFMEALMKGGEVFAPSHPGFGKSDASPLMEGVGDLAYFYLDFIEDWHLSDVLLIGANFGSWIAQEVAIRDSAKISALSLISPLGARFSASETEVEVVDIFCISKATEHELTYATPTLWKENIKELDDEQLYVLARDRESLCRYCWSPYMHNPDLAKWLHRISPPTLIIRGEKDGITSKEYALKYREAIKKSEVKLISETGHLPHIESHSQCAQLILHGI